MYYYFTDHQNGKKGPAITNISKNICSKQYPHIQMGVDHNIINNLGTDKYLLWEAVLYIVGD